MGRIVKNGHTGELRDSLLEELQLLPG
jgi:hypothetical protein